MEAADARRIGSEPELHAIAAAGSGFVIDPFNRRWHLAGCPRIKTMTLRLARYGTAKPILRCTSWCGRGSAPAVPHQPGTQPSQPGPGGPELRHPLIRNHDDGIDVWADEPVRNESKAASPAGRLRRSIAGGIRALPEPAARLLHASYAGWRWPGTDVENLLFNNIDQMLSLFTAAGRLGVRFEDLGPVAPPAPDGTDRQCYYSYRLIEPGGPFMAVAAGRLVCSVPEAVIPPGRAGLAARTWLAVSRARPRRSDPAPACGGSYMLRIAVCGLHPAGNIKALVDGASAAMQRDEPGRVRTAMARLSAVLGIGPDELMALATKADAPLGARSRSHPRSKECLFTLAGSAQVRVTPDDDRCIAAELVAAGDDSPPRIAVGVYAAKRRSPPDPAW